MRWRLKHPDKRRPTLDPLISSIGRYFCSICGEKKWYYINTTDKDMPQRHRTKKGLWLTLCHACWHLKGFYEKHQNAASFEGLSGCRICGLQLAAKRNRKRSQRVRQEQDTALQTRPGETKSGTANWEPTRVRSGVSVPSGRERGTDVQGERSTRRRTSEMPTSRMRKRMAKAGR